MSRIAERFLGDTPATYPNAPGFKESTISRDAANEMAADATILRERALAAIRKAGGRGLTADECALALGRDILSVRPRLSELRAANRIIPTGERRTNESGKKAMAWRAV